MLKVFNTETLKKEKFIPQVPNKIKMYVCGPTVYNYIHIGNARSAIAFDVIRRYLKYRGFQVDFVSNFTDVDDKIINRAKKEKTTENAITNKYIKAFYQDTLPLNVLPPTKRTRATNVIEDIINFIKDLVNKHYAYEKNGDVYFRVLKAKNYGRLIHESLETLETGASGRLNENIIKMKENPLDFALWKNEPRNVIKWDSPWGKGRPGWHIECSVMANKFLGDTLDIHGGGVDLVFPHHSDEIAQSEAHTGKRFVNYWLHNGFVNVNNEKMSKSLGNFTTVHELLKKFDDPVAIRYFMASTHYRRPINYSIPGIKRAQKELDRIRNAYSNLQEAPKNSQSEDPLIEEKTKKIEQNFIVSMDDDFNVANANTAIFNLIKLINSYLNKEDIKKNAANKMLQTLADLTGILGISNLNKKKIENIPDHLIKLLKKRSQARKDKNWQFSDELRNQALKEGYRIIDTNKGQKLERF